MSLVSLDLPGADPATEVTEAGKPADESRTPVDKFDVAALAAMLVAVSSVSVAGFLFNILVGFAVFGAGSAIVAYVLGHDDAPDIVQVPTPIVLTPEEMAKISAERLAAPELERIVAIDSSLEQQRRFGRQMSGGA